MQQQFVANAANLSKQQLSEIEKGTRRIEINEFIAITLAMGYKPGDLLENSGGVRADLKPLVDDLETAHPVAVRKMRDVLKLMDSAVTEAVQSATKREPSTNAGGITGDHPALPIPPPHTRKVGTE